MLLSHLNYKIFPLSDSAITIDFGNSINESTNTIVSQLFKSCDLNPFQGFIESVPAYASLTIFYDVYQVKLHNPAIESAFSFVTSYLENQLQCLDSQGNTEVKLIEIPVIYDGEDLAFVAEYTQLSVPQIIAIHTAPTYRVYMMGFLPGFAYLGGMDERIATPRKSTPRMKVPAGSVGIAGKQTGIYPLESPGGWQLIGHILLPLFTPEAESPTLLKAGDLVRFREN